MDGITNSMDMSLGILQVLVMGGSPGVLQFTGLQNTVDIDCSYEIKRCLLFGRKAMPNLDSILKSRDITNKGP